MRPHLLRMLTVLVCTAALTGAGSAIAKDWPAQTVRIVLPYPPGGASDVTARLLGQQLAQSWGTSVVIDNKPGANGIIANELVAKSAADGYTVLMANLGPNAINPAVYARLPYDMARDFAPVILTTKVPLLIVTAADSPIADLAQLILHARQQPGKLSFGSAGNGSGSHLAGELLAMTTGTKMLHVPYKGDAPALTDLMSNQLTVALPTALAGVPHVKAGKLRALAVTSQARIPSLPDVPTVDEALGTKGFEAVSWGGFMVPAGTPAQAVEKINAQTNKALQLPDIRSKLSAQGAEVIGGSPQAFSDFLRAELLKWKRVAETANVRLE